jgi:hypothetical protein
MSELKLRPPEDKEGTTGPTEAAERHNPKRPPLARRAGLKASAT